jgi:DNA mismatch repair protein MutS2
VHEKSVQALEFAKVLARVAQESTFSIGKERVLALEPTADLAEAQRRLAFTTEAVRLLAQQPRTTPGGAQDIRSQLTRAAREGTLSESDLLAVVTTLRSAISVNHLLADLEPGGFPQLLALRERMPVHPHLVRRIEETVSDEGEVLDAASPRLARLRGEIRSANGRLQQRLRTIVGEFGSALQEPIVTTRGDRYVLPVKADFRGRVRGIVHDRSSSGATLFIEPMVVVEMNNELRELQTQEREEVERILRELSHEIGREAEEIGWAVDALADFDLQLAKARYANLVQCSEPRLNDEGRILLPRARHPLLTGRAVPIDFRLGQATPRNPHPDHRDFVGTPAEFFAVVITGPNTGGKTVALKTVGLLTLMAQAGLHVPAADGAELAVFDDVFADIGDEQSIEQSLSTFSSHLTRIIEVLRSVETARRRQPATDSDRLAPMLVLFDELGAGTDPDEGAALASSILTYLLDRRVPTVATTHYSELKAFAHERKGAVNASVAFDVETLSPTYELEIGLPGRSNALAIAERLGLDQRIVRGARRHLGTTGVQMEDLLRDLERERDAAESERRLTVRERAEAERQRAGLEQERHRLEVERAAVLEEARAQARRELDAVLAELAEVRAAGRRQDLTREDVGELRRRTRGMEERVARVAGPAPPPRPAAEGDRLEGSLEVGDSVRVLSLDQTGELLSLSADGDDADVQLGSLRLHVGAADLQRVRRHRRADDLGRPVTIHSDSSRIVSQQLDMRGARVEDALEDLEMYLNDAALAGMSTVRILHGKGTGALRAAVREHLARHPLVQSSELAPNQEGGSGVTIVRLSA